LLGLSESFRLSHSKILYGCSFRKSSGFIKRCPIMDDFLCIFILFSVFDLKNQRFYSKKLAC